MFGSLQYILTIAAQERRMIYRTAKFWVLGGFGLVGVLFFMVVMTIVSIVATRIPGEFLLAGTDAYLALYFFGYIQAILIIFVASDFRKAEEKARLEEVMLSRPMTTANWVIGKYLGIVSGILYLNFFLLLIATIGRVIKVLISGAGFNILPFLQYYAIATFPSVLFMVGFVFFLVSLFRIQSIAIIVAAGYVASILFFFQHKYLGLFDYGGFFARLFSSDLIGFGNIEDILLQRLFFVLLGFAFVGSSILLYPRLWQSSWSRGLSIFSTVVFFACAGMVGYTKFENYNTIQLKRDADLSFQRKIASQLLCTVTHYDFDIAFGEPDELLKVAAKLTLMNPNRQPLNTLFFSLNEGLSVDRVNWLDGQNIEFEQGHQILTLHLGGRDLIPGGIDSLQVSYAGDINADDFMLDRLPESEGLIDKSNGPWSQPNRSAILTGNFAVLPAQVGWYPVPGPAVGYDFGFGRAKNFSTAQIRIRVPENLSVITQGRIVDDRVEQGQRIYRIGIATPVQGYSLNIGEYKRLAWKFDQMEIEIFTHRKHLLDLDLLEEVADTCYKDVETMLEIFENTTGLRYPYEKLSVVEVPLHMQVYMDVHGLNNVLLQPGIVMIDEVSIASKRLKNRLKRDSKRTRRRGRDDSPKTMKRELFLDIVFEIFFNDRLWRRDGTLSTPLRNYLDFQLDIRDPVLSSGLALQVYELCEVEVRDSFHPDRYNATLSSFEHLRQNAWGSWETRRRYGLETDSIFAVLTDKPLAQIQPEGDGNMFRAVTEFKAAPVLSILRKEIGEKNHTKALAALVEQYRYRPVHKSDFLDAMQFGVKVDVGGFFAQWFDQTAFPGYRILSAKADKMDTGKMQIAYHVKARVKNGEKGDGFVRVICNTKNNDKIRRSLALGSYEEKEVQFAVTAEPESIVLVPFFSRNRGQIMKTVSISNRVTRGTPVDTILTVQSFTDSSVFILDDQDEGFFTPSSAEAKYLRPPSKGASWWERTQAAAYGKYYFGWRIKRGGDGSYPARWQTHVPTSGDYELSFYFNSSNSWWFRRMSTIFKISITSADGTFPVTFRPQKTADGWYPLGRYRFTKEQLAVVELADEGDDYLAADAIRWELVQ